MAKIQQSFPCLAHDVAARLIGNRWASVTPDERQYCKGMDPQTLSDLLGEVQVEVDAQCNAHPEKNRQDVVLTSMALWMCKMATERNSFRDKFYVADAALTSLEVKNTDVLQEKVTKRSTDLLYYECEECSQNKLFGSLCVDCQQRRAAFGASWIGPRHLMPTASTV
jgi:hypothetical protein